MARIVIVTESGYRAITQWDDEGGAPCDVIYKIVPDRALEGTVKTTKEMVKKAGTKKSYTKDSAELEASLAARSHN